MAGESGLGWERGGLGVYEGMLELGFGVLNLTSIDLASLPGCSFLPGRIRGCRYAQSPSNGCDPSGIAECGGVG